MNKEQQLTLLPTIEARRVQQIYGVAFDPIFDMTSGQVYKVTDTPEGQIVKYFIPASQPQIDPYGNLTYAFWYTKIRYLLS